MSKIEMQKSMAAILYIMTELYNQRLGLNTSVAIKYFDQGAIDQIINEVNEISGLNYYNLSTDEDRLKYESLVGSYMTKILNQFKDKDRVSDEVALLKKSINIDVNQIEFKDIHISHSAIECLKDIRISLNGINSWLENPEFVILFRTEHNKDYLCTKVVQNEGIKKVLLYHINKEPFGLEVKSIFLLSYNRFNNMVNNPIRLFLFMVNEYGIDIIINNTTKKFHIEIESPDGNCEFRSPKKNTKIIGYTIGKTISPNKHVFHFAYGINLTSYVSDYKSKKI